MKLKSFIAAFVMLLVAGTTQAQTETQTQPAQPTQPNQQTRIKRGVKSGELTNHEANTLENQKKETRQDVKVAKSDGVINPAERKEIRQDRKKTSKAIYRKKHNARVSG